MDSFTLTVIVERNGQRLDDLCVTRRIACDEHQGFNYERASGAGYTTLPVTNLDEVQMLVMHVDQTCTLRLNAQSDAGIDFGSGGGLIVLVGVDLDAGVSTNATLETNSGNTTRVVGIGAGT